MTSRRRQAPDEPLRVPTTRVRHEHGKTSIAQTAARLIAEGLAEHHDAARKAAQQLGVGKHALLPNQIEVDQALHEHHALYSTAEQPRALAALREAAIRAMQWLRPFSPWISGPVLTGSANEFSAIELDLVGVEAKTFEMFLINDDVVFESHGGATTGTGIAQALVRNDITFDDAPVEITLFDSQSQRLSTFPKSSYRYDRAQLDEALARFSLK
jgi:hypothetical protein